MAANNLDALVNREITVLMGGWSAEREISLKTGKAVTDSIKSLGLKVRDIDLISPEEIEKIIRDKAGLIKKKIEGNPSSEEKISEKEE